MKNHTKKKRRTHRWICFVFTVATSRSSGSNLPGPKNWFALWPPRGLTAPRSRRIRYDNKTHLLPYSPQLLNRSCLPVSTCRRNVSLNFKTDSINDTTLFSLIITVHFDSVNLHKESKLKCLNCQRFFCLVWENGRNKDSLHAIRA